jgi:hypothetical protein
MTRMNIGLTAAVFVLSGALALAASLPADPQNQTPPRSTLKPIETQPNARYQIVNGTPDLTQNIMLLDTQTGKTWEVCRIDKDESWCAMHQYQEGEFRSIDDQKPSAKTPPGNPCLLVGDPNCSSR